MKKSDNDFLEVHHSSERLDESPIYDKPLINGQSFAHRMLNCAS
jgi:hypothetical protein